MKSKKNRRMIWIVSTVAIIAALILGGGWVLRRQVQAKTTPDESKIATAFIGSLSAQASASGQLLPQREAVLSLATAGRVEQVFVSVGDQVKAGDALVRMESDTLGRAVRTAEQNLAIQEANLAELLKDASQADMEAAQAALLSAQTQLDDLLAGPSEEDLAAAQAAVVSAQAQLDDLLAGPSDKELAQARAALASAQALEKVEAKRYVALDAQLTVARQQLDIAKVTLENAKYFYDALANDWQHKDYANFSPEAKTYQDAQMAYNVALARYNLSAAGINNSAYLSAQAQVAQAKLNLTKLTETKTVDVASAREQLAQAKNSLASLTEDKTTQIAAARSQLAQAQANLADLEAGASEEKIEIARAQVEQMRIALANAQARLADATLTAPFDGAVTAVHISVGEWASGQAVELVDTSSLEVVLDVDEVDIGNVTVGQASIVTLETWPNQDLQGTIVAIAPSANAQSDIVTYQVHIKLDAADGIHPRDLPIRTGMTANAQLITAKRDGVLLVANRAVAADRQAGKYYVYLQEGDQIIKTQVNIGLRDSSYTEITSGIQEGDKLVVDYAEQQGLPFGPGQ